MFENIPAELRDYAQWVVWRYEDRGGDKPTKVPYSPKTNALASVSDPATWGTYDEAVYCTLFPDDKIEGIGFVLTNADPFAFIDLDSPKCAPEELAQYQAIQARIAAGFETYAEVSPSGKGLHLICKGSVPRGKKNSKAGVEIYSELRYMTMTGNVYKNVAINDCHTLLNQLWQEMGGSDETETVVDRASVLSDEQVWNMAAGAKNGDRFMLLWQGHWQGAFPSQSEADQALMNMLAFYTQSHAQLARLFRLSVLGKRDKAKRDDYVSRMIAKGLDREIDLLDFTAFDAWFKSEVAKLKAEAEERERKRIAGIEAAIQAKHVRAEMEAAKAESSRLDATPYSLAPVMKDGEDFEMPPGLLGQIARFAYAQSPYPLPRTALASAIGFMSGLCGRAYNVNGVGVNLYTLFVAPTGVGKEAMSSAISKLAIALREFVPASSTYFGADQIASGQALYAAIKERKACLSIQGEFGIELQNLTHPRAPSPIKLLKKAYLELFTKSGEGQTLGASLFADKMKNTDSLRSPALSLLGETAPPHLYDALNETMLSDGLLPRFLLIEVDKGSDAYNAWAYTVQPERELMEGIAAMAAACLKLDHADRAAHIQLSEAAQTLSEQYRSITKRTTDSQARESGRQLWSRAHIKALKLAGIVAIGCNPFNPVVEADYLRWAITVVNDGTRRLSNKFERGDFGEGDARQTADVKRFLTRYCVEDGSTLPRFAFNDAWHQARMISYSYLRQNVIPLASFRNGVGGAAQSFTRCVKSLMDEGVLWEVPAERLKQYGTVGKLYAIVDASLL